MNPFIRMKKTKIHPVQYLFPVLLAIVCIGLFWQTFHLAQHTVIKAKTPVTREISFQSVYITNQDTLWSIASEYYSKDCGYDSLEEYIEEIKQCNSLESEAIYAGASLIVPIYVSVEQGTYS